MITNGDTPCTLQSVRKGAIPEHMMPKILRLLTAIAAPPDDRLGTLVKSYVHITRTQSKNTCQAAAGTLSIFSKCRHFGKKGSTAVTGYAL